MIDGDQLPFLTTNLSRSTVLWLIKFVVASIMNLHPKPTKHLELPPGDIIRHLIKAYNCGGGGKFKRSIRTQLTVFQVNSSNLSGHN